jgi:hypothetical protein
MEDCADQVETVMQWLSRSPTARRIDREIDKAQPPLGGQAMCSYLRYNVLLQSDWCAENLGETLGAKALKNLEVMDEPDNIPELDRIARLAGKKLVKAGHFEAAFDTPPSGAASAEQHRLSTSSSNGPRPWPCAICAVPPLRRRPDRPTGPTR